MTNLQPFEGNPDFVLSLARGLAVIEAFQDQQRPSKLLLKKASSDSLYVWVRCVLVRADR